MRYTNRLLLRLLLFNPLKHPSNTGRGEVTRYTPMRSPLQVHKGGTVWWYSMFYDTVAARLVVGLSPSPVRWNGTRFHTLSGTLLGVKTASHRR